MDGGTCGRQQFPEDFENCHATHLNGRKILRPLVEFSLAILAIVAAVISLTIPRERSSRLVQFVLLAIAAAVCIAALLFRGFSGKGVDDVIGQYLANLICENSALRWCKDSKFNIAPKVDEENPIADPARKEDERRKAEEERLKADAARREEERRKAEQEEYGKAELAKAEEGRRKTTIIEADAERRKNAVNRDEKLVASLTTVWKKVCTSARSARDAENQLREAGMGYLPSTIRMIPHWSQTPVCYKVTYPIPAGTFGLGEDHVRY
jgi:hypothetical protein